MANERIEGKAEHQGSDNEKEAYATPHLIVHGNIESITRGVEGGNEDMNIGGTQISGPI